MTATFCTTTYRPEIDRWIAKDGADVVLRGNERELLLLRHSETGWVILRHEAVLPDEGGLSWRGLSFSDAGEVLDCLSEDSNEADWRRIYRRL